MNHIRAIWPIHTVDSWQYINNAESCSCNLSTLKVACVLHVVNILNISVDIRYTEKLRTTLLVFWTTLNIYNLQLVIKYHVNIHSKECRTEIKWIPVRQICQITPILWYDGGNWPPVQDVWHPGKWLHCCYWDLISIIIVNHFWAVWFLVTNTFTDNIFHNRNHAESVECQVWRHHCVKTSGVFNTNISWEFSAFFGRIFPCWV